MPPKHLPCEKVMQIERVLNGNGEKGALEKIDDHETFIQQMRGIKIALVAIFGTSLLSAVVAIVSLIKLANVLASTRVIK